MSNPLIHSCDNYVILEPGKKEQIYTVEETLSWLEDWLNSLEELPEDLKSILDEKEKYEQLPKDLKNVQNYILNNVK